MKSVLSVNVPVTVKVSVSPEAVFASNWSPTPIPLSSPHFVSITASVGPIPVSSSSEPSSQSSDRTWAAVFGSIRVRKPLPGPPSTMSCV